MGQNTPNVPQHEPLGTRTSFLRLHLLQEGKAVRDAVAALLRLQPPALNDAEIQRQCLLYARSSETEQEQQVGALLADIAAPASPTAATSLVCLARLFQEDTSAFRELSFQRYFENVSKGTGFGRMQTLHIMAVMDSLEQRAKDDAQSRYHLHLILDLLSHCMERIQGDEQDTVTQHHPEFFPLIAKYAAFKSTTATNYLIRRRFGDMDELARQEVMEKPDALRGVAGASSDASLYLFRNVLKNYQLRTTHGLYEETSIAHPLLPIAPGYVALYEDGAVRRIFRARGTAKDPTEADALAESTHAYDGIYETLGQDTVPFAQANHQQKGGKLNMLRPLWALQEKLRQDPAVFLFDMQRVPAECLHPVVLAEIVDHNVRVLHEYQRSAPSLENVSEDTLMQSLYPDDSGGEEDLYRWHMLESLSLRKKIEDDFGVDIADYDLWIQRAFLEYIDTIDADAAPRIQEFLAYGNRRNRLIALTAARHDPAMADIVLTLGMHPLADTILSAYARNARMSDETSSTLLHTAREHDESTTLSQAFFFRSLLERGTELLKSAHQRLIYGGEHGPEDLHDLLEEFNHENDVQKVIRMTFLRFASALDGEDLDLRTQADAQQFVQQMYESAGCKAVMLKALNARGRLAPIPRITWLVDRPVDDYTRRLGVDLRALLGRWADPHRRQVIVEFGHGNGTCAAELCTTERAANFLHYGICDRVYYPLTPLVSQMIDWAAVERKTGQPLSHMQRAQIADFLYKILVIDTPRRAEETFEYDEEAMEDFRFNPNTIRVHLQRKAGRILRTDEVPDIEGSRNYDEKDIYPRWMPRPSDPACDAALRALADNMPAFLQTGDAYERVPAYPPGTIISDFQDIGHLRKEQIDAGISVRGTMYIPRGVPFIDFLRSVSHKLTKQGIHIDDSIRGNDGQFYRLRELLASRNVLAPETELRVIVGPALENEDHYQGPEGVPLAFIMTKDRRKLDDIQAELAARGKDPRTGAGYRLVLPEELAMHPEYLRLLDPAGETLQSLAV